MKKITVLIVATFVLGTISESFAQRFGVKGGLNLAKMLVKDDQETLNDITYKPGFHVGPTVEFPINEVFSFESGILLSTKGFKWEDEEISSDYYYGFKSKSTIYYLDIPLTGKATFDAGSVKIFGTFGPYLAIGLSGTTNYEYNEDGVIEKDEQDIKFGSDEEEDDLHRFDYGLTAGAGVGINAFELSVAYSLGLANISVYQDNGYTIRNRVIGISLAYKFGNKSE